MLKQSACKICSNFNLEFQKSISNDPIFILYYAIPYTNLRFKVSKESVHVYKI